MEGWGRRGEGRSHLGWCAHGFSHLEVEPSLSCRGGSTPVLKGYSSDLIQVELENNIAALKTSKIV